MNEILKRIYKIQPSIGAWARSGLPNVLWGDVVNAKAGMAAYVGPRADPLILNNLHITGDDRAFIMSATALDAIVAVIEAIYDNRPLVDGFLPEVASAKA